MSAQLETLRRELVLRDMTVKELARLSGFSSYPHVLNVVNGRAPVTLKFRVKTAQALRMSEDALFPELREAVSV